MSKYLIVGVYCDVGDSYRKCDIEIKVGTAATMPTVPTFTNNQTKTYLTLAAVRLNAATTEIKQSNITDYRESLSKCGYCRCILGKCKWCSEILDAYDKNNRLLESLQEQVSEAFRACQQCDR